MYLYLILYLFHVRLVSSTESQTTEQMSFLASSTILYPEGTLNTTIKVYYLLFKLAAEIRIHLRECTYQRGNIFIKIYKVLTTSMHCTVSI